MLSKWIEVDTTTALPGRRCLSGDIGLTALPDYQGREERMSRAT